MPPATPAPAGGSHDAAAPSNAPSIPLKLAQAFLPSRAPAIPLKLAQAFLPSHAPAGASLDRAASACERASRSSHLPLPVPAGPPSPAATLLPCPAPANCGRCDSAHILL